MNDNVLGQMEATRSTLTEMLSDLSPETPEQTAQFQNLRKLRDRLTSAINHATERGFKASGAEVESALFQLTELNHRLNNAKDKIEGLKTGFEIASKVLSVITAIIGFIV